MDGELYEDVDFMQDLEEIQNQLNVFDKLKDFISKYGPKAVEFIKCMVSLNKLTFRSLDPIIQSNYLPFYPLLGC